MQAEVARYMALQSNLFWLHRSMIDRTYNTNNQHSLLDVQSISATSRIEFMMIRH